MRNYIHLKLFALFPLIIGLGACSSNPTVTKPKPITKITEVNSHTKEKSAISWARTGSTNYENTHPGYGKSLEYKSTVGVVTMYDYDLQTNWKSGVSDPKFDDAFNSTMREIYGMKQRGYYQDVTIGKKVDIAINGMTFRKINFNFTLNGKRSHSTTLLTAVNGRLLKYRISLYHNTKKNIDEVANEFIEKYNPETIGDIV